MGLAVGAVAIFPCAAGLCSYAVSFLCLQINTTQQAQVRNSTVPLAHQGAHIQWKWRVRPREI